MRLMTDPESKAAVKRPRKNLLQKWSCPGWVIIIKQRNGHCESLLGFQKSYA